MRLYPFEVPAPMHPYAWLFLGLGLSPEQISRCAQHVVDDLGMRPVESWETMSFAWAVDVQGDHPDHMPASVGDVVDVQVAEQGAVRLAGGAPPPGVRLEKSTGRLVGTLTHPGLYSVTVTVGPAVKYDPLGSPGGPGDPGEWIPVTQDRQPRISALTEFPPTAEDLNDFQRDQLLAELLAWRNGETVKEADGGN